MPARGIEPRVTVWMAGLLTIRPRNFLLGRGRSMKQICQNIVKKDASWEIFGSEIGNYQAKNIWLLKKTYVPNVTLTLKRQPELNTMYHCALPTSLGAHAVPVSCV